MKPLHISQKHWDELTVGSGIDPELASLNVTSLQGTIVYDYLLYSNKIERLNAGRLSSYWMKSYQHLGDGGWWCNGVDLVSGEDSQWGCFKPDKPRQDKEGKIVKYEHPPKTATECFFLKVSVSIFKLIAAKAGKPLPKDYQEVIEKPIIFWKWVCENNVTILLTEGVKKTLAALSSGYAAIGFPGISSVCKIAKDSEGNKQGNPFLIPQLKPFLGTKRKIIFAFDSDNKRSTIRNGNREINKAGTLFQLNSCSVNVAVWEHRLGKGLDDVLVNYGTEKIDEIYRNCKKFHEWKTYQLKQFTYKPNIELDRKYLLVQSSDGNLDTDFQLSNSWGLLWIKAHKGAGKTSFINHLVSPLVASGERKILLLTHRVSLGKAICNDLGLFYIDEDSSDIVHSRSLGLCADSLLKINPDDWKGCYLILDELQQLKWHILNSSTCRKKRVAILKHLKKLLNVIHQSGGKIIIADADLRDDGIDFILNQIEGEVDIFGILNSYVRDENDRWKIYHYADKDPSRLVANMIEKLALGQKIMVCCSGQKANSTWGTQTLEAYVKEQLPEVKILRVDSISVSETTHAAFGALNHFQESIQGYQLVICSPTIETGVSLDFSYFDAVFGIFQGVQSCDSVRQHLSRYRKPVPRYLFLAKAGINGNRIGNGANNVRSLLAGEYRKDKANILNLIPLGYENLQGNYENFYINQWAICGALINDGFQKYRAQILEDLEAEGHQILDYKNIEQTEYNADSVKECKEKIYLSHVEEIAAAKDISPLEFEILDKKLSLSKEQRLQLEKAKLANKYQIPVTPNLIIKNDDNFYQQVRLHYLIENHDSFVRQERNYFNSAINNEDGQRNIWDDNKQSLGAKVYSLVNVCKIKEVLMTEGLHEYHPLAVQVGDNVRKYGNDLKLFLCDFKDPKKPQPSNMFILRRLVKLIGYKIPQLNQHTVEYNGIKKRVRLHGLPQPDLCCLDSEKSDRSLILNPDGSLLNSPDDREKIFQAWKDKEALEIAREEELAAKARDIVEAISRSEQLTQSLVSEMEGSAIYSEIKTAFEDNIRTAIKENSYFSAVFYVEDLERLTIKADNLGRLTKEQFEHNKEIKKILEDVLSAYKEGLRIMQKEQSRWYNGDRQLVAA